VKKLRAPFIAVTLLGCSGREAASVPDAAVPNDATAATDTRPEASPVEASVNPPAAFCIESLPKEFACARVVAKTGMTVCTDDATEALSACLGGAYDAAKCSAARSAHEACAKCAFATWAYATNTFDIGACLHAVDPGSPCGDAWRCNADCLQAVCGGCSPEPRTGGDGGSSEFSDCFDMATRETSASGYCYKHGVVQLAACRADPKTAVCFVDSAADAVRFVRGACRDGGVWTAAAGDSGTD